MQLHGCMESILLTLCRYATAKDEVDSVYAEQTTHCSAKTAQFEIAAEETEKMTVYAQDDREAAREELENLKAAYKKIIDDSDQGVAQEVQLRIGQRIRELDNAVQALEELAQNQD